MLSDRKAIAETENALAWLRSAAAALGMAAMHEPAGAELLQAFAAEARMLHDRLGRHTGLRPEL